MNKNEGGLHTQGEWQLSKSGEVIYCGVISVATTHGHSNSKANAELIVKAVNEREKLLASNRELVDLLNEILPLIKKGSLDIYNISLVDKIQTAINNSKQ